MASSAPERKPKQRHVAAGASRRERHLRIVPPQRGTAAPGPRQVRETRWTAALLIFATVALCALWTAGMMGATRTAWWPLALAAVFGCVVAFGLLVIRKTR